MRSILIALLLATAFISGPACTPETATTTHRLVGFAMLPAETFVPGPTSGQFIDGANGIAVPFEDRQPIQGFSGLVHHPVEGFLAVSDNGFGSQDNSADHLLRVVHIVPEFRIASGGSGSIEIRSSILLHDTTAKAGFRIAADMEHYPSGEGDIPVDPRILEGRLLTGSDFDLESICRMPDGTLWLGDEFGPFLLHVDSHGRLLRAPVPLPGVFSPQHPLRGDAPANIAASGGFEGMAMSADGSTLYPMLEKRLADAPADVLFIYEFDPVRGEYRGEESIRRYRLSSTGHKIAAFRRVADRRFLITERDDYEGLDARFKKVFLVDFEVVDAHDVLVKRELVDLLRIPDPDDVGGYGPVFSFPFVTPESLVVIDANTIGVLNDNNFPFSRGRPVGTAQPGDAQRASETGRPDERPDNSEFILIRFDTELADLEVTGPETKPRR